MESNRKKMRIISGLFKGKIIKFLKNSTTRPLKDIVKENIFNILCHSRTIKVDLINANVLDLYSGIGSFGIECLSRGAKKVTFIETDYGALNILKENINELSISNKVLMVKYQGACGTCPSASTGTLEAIKSILRDEYDPELDVYIAPEMY